MSCGLAKEINCKTPAGVHILNFEFASGDNLASGETINGISGTPSVSPSGGSHCAISGQSFSGTKAQLIVTSGVAPFAFTVDTATDTFTAAAHGLSNNDRVMFIGSSLPTGIKSTIRYYVVSAATNTFQVSLDESGPAVDVTATGSGLVGIDYVLSIAVTTTAGQTLEAQGILQVR